MKVATLMLLALALMPCAGRATFSIIACDAERNCGAAMEGDWQDVDLRVD